MKKNKILISAMCCLLLAVSLFTFQKSEVQAAGNYTLQVNKGTNVVTVFRSDGTPERAFVCSVGSATPIGTFYTPNKYRWHELDGPSYGQYCTRIVAGYLFHSVWYYRNGDLASQSYVQYNKLGTTASHGCVRLTVADAKWIYDNCPLGTKVTVMYGSSANDPLGKPAAIKVPNVREGWDPTDPNPANPYSAAMPSIDTSGASQTVSYGSDFNPLTGITAKDSLGNDISGKLAYAGSVNTSQLGDYRITYRVTDALNRTAYADKTYTVADTGKAEITGVKKSLKKEYNSTLKLKKNVKAKTVTGKSLTKQITIKIISPGSKKEKTYKKSTLKLKKLGTYKINYYVTNPANGLVTKATCKVKVSDTKKPKFSGVAASKTVEYNSTLNLKSGVKAKLVSGKNMTSKITVKVQAPNQTKLKKLSSSKIKSYKFTKIGTYKVEYSVANPNNKKAIAKKTTNITVSDTKAPVIAGAVDQTVAFGSKLNLRTGITAKLVSGTNVTANVKVTVKTPANASSEFTGTEYTFTQAGVYTIEYSVANPANPKAVAQASRKITVNADTRKPVITIDSSKANTAVTGTPYDVYAGVKASLDQDLTSAITAKVTNANNQEITVTNKMVTFTEAGVYTITYTVKNPNNPAVAETKTFTVTVSAQNTTPDNAPAAQSAPEFMSPQQAPAEAAQDEVQPSEPAEDKAQPEVPAEDGTQPEIPAEDEAQPEVPAEDEVQPEVQEENEVQQEAPTEEHVSPEVPEENEPQPKVPAGLSLY